MPNIARAQEVKLELTKQIKKQVPELKFNVDLGINPETGEYTLEFACKENSIEKLQKLGAFMTLYPKYKELLRYKGFLLNITTK